MRTCWKEHLKLRPLYFLKAGGSLLYSYQTSKGRAVGKKNSKVCSCKIRGSPKIRGIFFCDARCMPYSEVPDFLAGKSMLWVNMLWVLWITSSLPIHKNSCQNHHCPITAYQKANRWVVSCHSLWLPRCSPSYLPYLDFF